MKKVCVVTGSRAEYGLLRWVMDGIKKSNLLDLKIIVTGMHLAPEYGLTFNDIKKDCYYFQPDRIIWINPIFKCVNFFFKARYRQL